MIFQITPSRFPSQPIRYGANQIGHMAIGYIAYDVTGSLLVVALFYGIIEAMQITANPESWVVIDSAEDALHVAIGVILRLGFAWVLLPWACILAYGIWRRT